MAFSDTFENPERARAKKIYQELQYWERVYERLQNQLRVKWEAWIIDRLKTVQRQMEKLMQKYNF